MFIFILIVSYKHNVSIYQEKRIFKIRTWRYSRSVNLQLKLRKFACLCVSLKKKKEKKKLCNSKLVCLNQELTFTWNCSFSLFFFLKKKKPCQNKTAIPAYLCSGGTLTLYVLFWSFLYCLGDLVDKADVSWVAGAVEIN